MLIVKGHLGSTYILKFEFSQITSNFENYQLSYFFGRLACVYTTDLDKIF